MSSFSYWKKALIVLIVLAPVWPVFVPGYFSHHDDLQVIRIFEMRQCFSDYQIPCRWVPDMGYGFGYPLYNFYSAFPYYLGGVMSYFLGFIGSAKVLFFLPLVLAPVFMYLFVFELFKDRSAAAISAVLYAYLPYRALDIYVRGAVAESFAMSVFPLIFYFLLAFARGGKKKHFLGLTFSLFVLLTSHNIMTMLFMPVFALFVSIFLLVRRNAFFALKLISALVLAIGLSGFFLLPAFFEKDLVQSASLTTGALDFRNHFVSIKQLFVSREWGYGASVPGVEDSISFQVGIVHWAIVLFAGVYFILRARKFNWLERIVFIFFVGIFMLSIFMTHNKSAFIWESFDILAYVQFPWRLLAFAGFSASVIGGYLAMMVGKNRRFIFTVFIISATVVLNFSYFRPGEFFVGLTDEEKLSGELWDIQRRGAILDYLPVGAKEPVAPAFELEGFEKTSKAWKLEVIDGEGTTFVVPVFDFPGWRVFLDGVEIEHTADSDGLINFVAPEGRHVVAGRFENTGVRTLGNVATVLSAIILLLLATKYEKKIFE